LSVVALGRLTFPHAQTPLFNLVFIGSTGFAALLTAVFSTPSVRSQVVEFCRSRRRLCLRG
jgi:hypothetical protein